jgi:bifunctional non-homologous end joining protein LigD
VSTTRFPAPTTAELAELNALGRKGIWKLQGRELALTNLDKVLFAGRDGEEAVRKRELIRYYATLAPYLLPYLEGRALNLHRYPDGVHRPGFWQKQVPSYAPAWITTWRNEDADPGESQEYIVADSAPTLAWLANHGAVELHPWTSRLDAPDCPTYALIDLDPGTATTWDELLVLARLHRTALEQLGVEAYPKTSGRRGLQIWIPIRRGPTFDETRAWVARLSHLVGRVVPELVSWAWEKHSREGRARLDYTQNAVNKTLVAPFSVRAALGAPVSMPLEWRELDDPELRPDRWTVRNATERLERRGDPMAPMLSAERDLPSLG